MAARVKQAAGAGLLQEALRRRPALKRRLGDAGLFLLGLALGAGRLFSAPGPFGLAIVAAAGWELRGFLCLAGTAVGYLLAGGLFGGIRYIAAALLIFTVGFVTQGMQFRKQTWVMPAAAAFIAGLTGLFYGLDTAAGVPGSVRVFLETVLTGGLAWLFARALERPRGAAEADDMLRGIGAAALAACALMALGPVELFHIASIGRALAMTAVLAAGFCGGPMPGCAAGCAMGLAMDMAEGAVLWYGAAWAFAGLAAGALYRFGKLTFSVSFCAANAVAVLLGWGGEVRVSALYECFIASVVFMLLPQAALSPVGSLLRVGRGRGETAYRLFQADRLTHLSAGFRKLYDCASRPAPERTRRGEAANLFDRAADAVCRDCVRRERCWKTDSAGTVKLLSPLLDLMARKGTIAAADMPEEFRRQCVRLEAFVGTVNGELRGLAYRRQYRARLKEGRAAAYGQFVDMAQVMEDAARELSGAAGPDMAAERRLIRYLKTRDLEGMCSVFRDGRGRLHALIEGPGAEALGQEPNYLETLSEVLGVRLCQVVGPESARMVLRQAEPLAVSVGIASLKKEGESVSGDRGTYFKTDYGTLCVILSDGMGSGEDAARESQAAVEILEELLKAGMEPGCAMRLLNSAAMLKNGDEWGYATVDLCCIDLFTGETQFIKYGAAPSYIKTGRAIRRVKGTSLAAGMLAGEGSAPDLMRMRLRPGNVALIASDGVLAENSDQWLRDILASADGTETKDLAKAALRAASGRFGNADDMTALAIRVEERQ